MTTSFAMPQGRAPDFQALPTIDTFYEWMRRAKSGDRFVYHTGNLSQDVRLAIVGRKNARLPNTRLTGLRRAIADAQYDKLVMAVQKALPFNNDGQRSFEYIAIRTGEPWV